MTQATFDPAIAPEMHGITPQKETSAPVPTEQATQTPAPVENKPQEPANPPAQPEQKPTDDGFKFEDVFSRYKNDPQTLARSKWEQDKVVSKQNNEINELKKQIADFSAKAQSVQSEQPKEQSGPNLIETVGMTYGEIFHTGKATKSTEQFVKLGMNSNDARDLTEAIEYIVQSRIKQAQSQVQTDVKTLSEWAKTNLSDDERKTINDALAQKNYAILKDVEKKYKSTQKVTVDHGSISPGIPQDAYTSPFEYNKDKGSMKYITDAEFKAKVDAKFRRSNTDDWSRIMFLGPNQRA